MKTIEIKIYSFDELSTTAKKAAISNELERMDHQFIYDEAYSTVKAFNDVFGTKEGRNSWLSVDLNSFEDNVLNLQGFRLQKYIWNNYKNQLFKGKYYSLWSQKEKSYKHYKEGYPVLKSRRSKLIKDKSCVLTGMCYDDDMLSPIYEFLEKRDFANFTINFEELINECFNNISKTIENEKEYRESEEGLSEEIESQGLEFLQNGQIY